MKPYTHPTILQQMYQGYHTICWDQEPEQGPLRNKQDEQTRQCFDQQNKIGWYNIFLGRINRSWAILMKI